MSSAPQTAYHSRWRSCEAARQRVSRKVTQLACRRAGAQACLSLKLVGGVHYHSFRWGYLAVSRMTHACSLLDISYFYCQYYLKDTHRPQTLVMVCWSPLAHFCLWSPCKVCGLSWVYITLVGQVDQHGACSHLCVSTIRYPREPDLTLGFPSLGTVRSNGGACPISSLVACPHLQGVNGQNVLGLCRHWGS